MTRKQYLLLRIIFILAALSAVGSLYVGSFGDPVMNWQLGSWRNPANAIVPCNLCRYIRAFTYPAVLVSAVGIVRKDVGSIYSLIRLAILSLLFCAYKYALEMGLLLNTGDSFLCTNSSVDCADAKPIYFGFITLALMGLVVNVIVIICGYLFLRDNKKHPIH
ncbi:MAG: hypothetical protein WC004_03205 [Candidatus Absconditabacterales bacterium]